MWWGRRGDHEIDGGHGDGARQGVWCGGQMGGEQGSGQGCPHVYNVLKCFMLETTWRRTLKVILEKVLSNTDVVQKFFHAGRVWRLTCSEYTEERLSACELCAKAFSSGNNLKIHRLGEGLTNADIEDVVTNILPKPQPWRPMSFSTAERSTKGEKGPCVYMSAPKLALKLFDCVLDESPCS